MNMGVYINMEMPHSCEHCELCYDFICCSVTGTHVDYPTMDTQRLGDCPLVAVPEPHGDLIDRDAVKGSIKPWSPEDERSACTFDTVKKLMHTMLNRAPTIIPASGEG